MAKSKKPQHGSSKTTPQQRPGNGPPTAPTGPSQPTDAQLARITEAERIMAALDVEHGRPGPTAEAERLKSNLDESLKRLESLLADARGHYETARAREAAATEARDGNEARARELSRREAESRGREADLLDRSARLTERENDAEQGFLALKARALQPLEGEVARLRDERDRLSSELAERRSKAEEDARASTRSRAEKWAQEDAARTSSEAAARRRFDDAMAKERDVALAKLRADVQVEREQSHAALERELGARTEALEARAAGLDERETSLVARAARLRAQMSDLQAGQEMLAEDKAALDRKVERLLAERTEDLRHEVASLAQQLADARRQRDAYFRDLESRRELDRRFGDRTPERIVADLEAVERERDALAQQLRERPDARAAERLAELERERSAWLEERASLQGGLARATGELATRRLAAIELETHKKEKEALEVHKQLLSGAVDELRTRVEDLTRQDDNRNPMTALTSLDANEELQTPARTTSPFGKATPTLSKFAEDLRHRIAGGVEGRILFYAERDVRAFLGGLSMTRMMLLQGTPARARRACRWPSPTRWVPVWRSSRCRPDGAIGRT